MASENLLCDSFRCRLCAEENKNSIDIFPTEQNQQDLSALINKYLPFQIKKNELLPKKICPGCHIQLEATKIFMDLIIEGQIKLSEKLRLQTEKMNTHEKQRKNIEEVLKNINSNSSVESFTIVNDDIGEQYVIQVVSDAALFSPDHDLSLKVEGLEKPKKKRGRPPKSANVKELEAQSKEPLPPEEKSKIEEEVEEVYPDGRKKRKIKAPTRYQGVVQGKELDKMFVQEGVIDNDEVELIQIEEPHNEIISDEIIGRVETESDGKKTDHPVFLMKNRHTNPGILRKKQKWLCPYCKKEFYHYGRYEYHLKKHVITYICDNAECNFESDNYKDLESHQNDTGHVGHRPVEKVKNYGTEVFDVTHTEKIPEEPTPTETIQSTRKKRHTCEECNKVFSCKQNYLVHYRAVHQGYKPFPCNICDKSFSYRHSLKLHKLVHKTTSTSERQFPCNICDRVLHSPSSLIYHRETEHSNGRKYVCNKCNKSFKHNQLLQRHQVVHSAERPFKCPFCKADFKSQSNLNNHVVIHTGHRKFICRICNKNFTHKSSLTLHLRWHTGSKPFKCDVCQKGFAQNGNLVEHRRTHTGEKPYECSMCQKTFTTASQVKLHMKRHTGEKPWQCSYCQQQFLHGDSYKNHVRRHLNEKPHICRTCNRSFTDTWSLKKHERLHTGEKPYKCEVCGKCFSDNSNMIKHRRIHLNHQPAGAQVIEYKPQVVSTEASVSNGEISLNTVALEDIPELDAAKALNLRQLVDQDGNTISLTTHDGKQVRVVASMDDNTNIQGLLSDGTLVPIDLSTANQDEFEIEEISVKGDMLDSSIEFLNAEDDINVIKCDKLDTNIQFLTDNQEMCLVTTYSVAEDNILRFE